MRGRSHDRMRATTVAAAAALAVLPLVRYRDALATFFFLDDFWVMRDAARVGLDSSGIAAVFRPGRGEGQIQNWLEDGY